MKSQTRFHSPDANDIDSIWQLLYPQHFINVLLIHHLKQRYQKDIEEIASIMQDGLTNYGDNTLFWFKNPFRSKLDHEKIKTFKISDIFESFHNENGSITEPKLILIDGTPGMGKTTLCKQIAYQWAEGKLLKDTKMIFLLFLRDPAIQNMHNLSDVFQYIFKFASKSLNLDVTKRYVEIFEKRNNSDITILLNGYDELNDKGDNSLVTNIIKHKILPQCRVVITSRPIASEKLQKLADVRVEVLGFSDQSKREYIKEELKDHSEKARLLLSYLDDHSDINEACYIPIIMTAMVCSFKEYEELPTNQSEIYERFVALVISRYLQKLDNTFPKSILSFNALPENYQTYLLQLSEFAFKTMESDQVIFNSEDIEIFSDTFALSSKKLHGLGLFKATEQFSLKKMDNCVWYNFLHLSIHEFLAAFYVKSLNVFEQFKHLNRTFFNQRYFNVWIIFIGLQQVKMYNFHQFLTYSHMYRTSDAALDEMKLILQKLNLLQLSKVRNINIKYIEGTFQLLCYKNNKDNLQGDVIQKKFVETVDSRCLLPFTFSWRKLFVSLCSVANSNQLVEIYLLDKNTRDASYHQVVTELEQNHNLSIVLVSNGTLVGYRCNYLQLTDAIQMNGLLNTVILRHCLINDEFVNALSSNLIKLQRLAITDSTIKSDQVGVIIKSNLCLAELRLSNTNLGLSILKALKENSELKFLSLNSNNMTGEVAEDLANVIKNNPDLQRLYLSNNNLGPSTIMILQALKENSRLQILNLNNNNMTGEVAEDLANVIKNNPYLQELYLSNDNLGPSTIMILQALKENSRLQILNLNNNNMTGEVAEDLANVIKTNSHLEKLGLESNNLGSSAIIILQALKENFKLQMLYLDNNNMTGEVAEDLANVIKNNPDLQKLYLSNNNLGPSTIMILQALKENSRLQILNLNNNNMTGEVAEDLANVIKTNSHLEKLGLESNNLGSSAIIILQALKENSKLQMLDLDNNNMTGEVAEDLANVIKNNPDLQELTI